MLFVSTAANKTKTCKSIIKMTRVYKKKNGIILAKCCHLECLNFSFILKNCIQTHVINVYMDFK